MSSYFEMLMAGTTGRLLEEMGVEPEIFSKGEKSNLTELEMLLTILRQVSRPILRRYSTYDGLVFDPLNLVWFINCRVSFNGKYIDVYGQSPEEAAYNCINLFTGLVLYKDSDSKQYEFFCEFREDMDLKKKEYRR